MTTPKVIVLCTQKGGSGKTTLALHLAVTAGSAALVDLDPQGTAERWHSMREGDAPLLATGRAEMLPRLIEDSVGNGIDWLIVDTPGRVDRDTVRAVSLADFVLIPVQPTIVDIWAMDATVAMIKEGSKRAGFVITRGAANRAGLEPPRVRESRELIAKVHEMPVYPGRVTNREAFHDAFIGGQAVTESEPRGKAAREITDLWAWTRSMAEGAKA